MRRAGPQTSSKQSPRGTGATLFRFDQDMKSQQLGARPFRLVGIDEAGRGPWAGPVTASAVCLPPQFFDSGLADSKLLSPQTRERLHGKITAEAVFGIAVIEVEHIDAVNILRATHQAMKNALLNLLEKHPELTPDLVVVDGRPVPDMGYPQKNIVKGDQKSAAIAAAGILAKVTRDRIMLGLHERYPDYDFASHKGYGTKKHLEKLLAHGPCPIHRKSFRPVKEMIGAAART